MGYAVWYILGIIPGPGGGPGAAGERAQERGTETGPAKPLRPGGGSLRVQCHGPLPINALNVPLKGLNIEKHGHCIFTLFLWKKTLLKCPPPQGG